jgi:tetratricopeptide (TPR) repeat protein
MEPANDTTVLGDFNDAVLAADGVTSRFFRRDGNYFIHTQDSDGAYRDFEVKYTFGYFPLQQYLVEFPGGRMQATRASWDVREKRWFHQYPGDTIVPNDWLHWTGNGQNWNTMCASCHSTNLVKNYDANADAYQTTWSEINVSCESCHGPGSRHIDYVNSKAYKRGQRIPDAGLWYGRDTITQRQLHACAACHARKSDIAAQPMLTGEVMDDLIPQVISSDFYYADGQIREEDYEYGSFTQSKMFHQNVRCSQCHNPHSGKTYHSGNTLCLQCHKPVYDSPLHHFHKPGTEAALCINCHMTVRTYMGNDHRRDHSFRVPRPDQSVNYATPNACTGCHKEKSNGWAAEAVKNWYGPERKHHFSDDLLPGSRLDSGSVAPLVRLLGDTLQPAIARATAAYYLGSLPSARSAAALRKALTDRHAIVRYQALRAMADLPLEEWQQAAAPLLRDPVRAVRIAAADLFHPLPVANIPEADREVFALADKENKAYLHYQADFAVGNVMLGDYFLQGGDAAGAIPHYVRGLRKDSLMNYARFNLAVAYNTTGDNAAALRTLQTAAAIDPFNDRAFYTLGLLHVEMGNIEAALDYLDRAVGLNTTNPQVYYNYGLLLQQSGKPAQAEQILLRGVTLAPESTALHYALAFLYLQTRQTEKALPHAKALHLLDPGNPDYQPLFDEFNL